MNRRVETYTEAGAGTAGSYWSVRRVFLAAKRVPLLRRPGCTGSPPCLSVEEGTRSIWKADSWLCPQAHLASLNTLGREQSVTWCPHKLTTNPTQVSTVNITFN